jgi:hypothetical protein
MIVNNRIIGFNNNLLLKSERNEMYLNDKEYFSLDLF